MAKATKYNKRCKKFREQLSEVIHPIMDQHFDVDGPLNKSAFGGIVRDTFCFYIAEKFGGNVNFYRGYHIPSTYSEKCYKAFLEQYWHGLISYEEMKDYFISNRERFQNTVKGMYFQDAEDKSLYVMFDTKEKSHVRIKDGKALHVYDEFATTFPILINEEQTIKALENYTGEDFSNVIITTVHKSKLYDRVS